MLLNLVSKNSQNTTLLSTITVEIFKVSLFSYIVFTLIDTFANNFISDVLSLTPILVVAIITGCISSLVPHPPRTTYERMDVKRYIITAVLSLVSAVIIYTQLRETNAIALPLAIMTGFISAGITTYIFTNPNSDTHHD